MQKHPHHMRLHQFVPPSFVATLLGMILLALVNYSGSILLTSIAGAYILADLTATVWTASGKGWQYLPLLPLVYAIIHTSYGLGFLVGLIKFADRWGDKTGRVPAWPKADV